MDINILEDPPKNIPQIRHKYRRASLIALALTILALCVGAASVFFTTSHDSVLQYSSFSGFIAFGFVFVYFSEKLMGYRRLGVRQIKELRSYLEKYPEIAEYCRKVSAQERYIVVMEFDSMAAYIDKKKGSSSDHNSLKP